MRAYICRFAGCNVLIDKPGYCKKHYKPPVEKKAFDNAVRANNDMYHTYRWKKMREEIIKAHPYCCKCGSEYRLEVHHITAPRGNENLFFNSDNCVVLCKDCHAVITAQEIRERKNQ